MTQEERIILIRQRRAEAEAARREGRPPPVAAVGAERTGRGTGPRTTLRTEEDRVRIHVVGGQSYAPAHLPGMPPPPDPNSPRAQWPPAYQAMSDRDVRRTRMIWLRSMNVAGETRGLREGHQVVRDEAEIARTEGNLAAQRIGTGLLGLSAATGQPIPVAANVAVPGAANVVSANEMQYGRMAPMATFSSAGVGTPAEVQAATDVRHGAYAVILNTLRQAVAANQDALVKLPGDSGGAMTDLANAYTRWRAVAWRNGVIQTGDAVTAANAALQQALQRFLATFR